jgi:hypothetical protein
VARQPRACAAGDPRLRGHDGFLLDAQRAHHLPVDLPAFTQAMIALFARSREGRQQREDRS